MPTKIAIIEDDELMAQLLCAWLSPYRYECHCFASGEAFLTSNWQTNPVDLLLIDWQLPGMSGVDLIKRLIPLPKAPAMIFVTALDSPDALAKALHTGADDFISKPVNKSILLARIRAVMRRKGKDLKIMNPQLDIYLRPGSLDVINHQGHSCKLSPAQYRALELLLKHEEQIVDRARLIATIWGSAPTGNEGRALDLLISRLRKKLQALPHNPISIVGHYGEGYSCYRKFDSIPNSP